MHHLRKTWRLIVFVVVAVLVVVVVSSDVAGIMLFAFYLSIPWLYLDLKKEQNFFHRISWRYEKYMDLKNGCASGKEIVPTT